MPGPGVHRHAPGVAKPVGPGFGAGSLHCDERIVRRHRVEAPRVRAVHVDAQHLGQQVVQSLAHEIGVGIAGPVAGGDVHQPLGTEGDGGAVVTVGLPFDDHLGRVGLETVGRGAVHPVAGDANALVAVRNPVVAADEEVAVLLEGWMEGDAVGQGFPEVVQDFVGAAGRVSGGPAQPGLGFPGVLVDEPQALAPRLLHHHHRVGQRELGEGPHHPVGGRWVGGADHPRGYSRPSALELLQGVGLVPVRAGRTRAKCRRQEEQTQGQAEPNQARSTGGRGVELESHSWPVRLRPGSVRWTAGPG